MQKTSPRLLVALILTFIVLIVMLVMALPTGNADATVEEDCDIFYGHSGHIPGSYDYAEFYEDGQLVTTVQTNGEDVFVNPAGWDAGESWDQVNKCHNGETPPPPPSVTADCLILTIDAAEGVTYAVQIGDGFVEVEGTQTFTGEAGQSWAVFYNDQTLASGVFESCSTTTTVADSTTTTSNGGTPPPDSTTTIPDSTTTTEVVPSTTTPPQPPELPFTGIGGTIGWLLAGVVTLGLGVSALRRARRYPSES